MTYHYETANRFAKRVLIIKCYYRIFSSGTYVLFYDCCFIFKGIFTSVHFYVACHVCMLGKMVVIDIVLTIKGSSVDLWAGQSIRCWDTYLI